MRRNFLWIPDVDGRYENQSRLGSLYALNGIEYLDCALKIDLFRSLSTTIPTCAGTKIYDIRTVKGGCEI